MTIPQWIVKTQNINISSVGTVFTHSLSWQGVAQTPSGTWGETRIVLRSAGANSAAVILSLSDSVTVTLQSLGGNSVTADVICQLYHSIIA
jgi:hypothetical protein